MADRIEPISHIEKVITGTAEPISHLEWIIATYGGGSGSGGTTNYNDLTNKPSINGITLTNTRDYERDKRNATNRAPRGASREHHQWG